MNLDEGDRIHLEQIEVFSRVGVTENERSKPQRLVLNLTLWPTDGFTNLEDDISRAVNYSAIHATVRDFMEQHSFRLIETFATELISQLMGSFPLRRISVEIRKFVLPGTEFVSVRIMREARA